MFRGEVCLLWRKRRKEQTLEITDLLLNIVSKWWCLSPRSVICPFLRRTDHDKVFAEEVSFFMFVQLQMSGWEIFVVLVGGEKWQQGYLSLSLSHMYQRKKPSFGMGIFFNKISLSFTHHWCLCACVSGCTWVCVNKCVSVRERVRAGVFVCMVVCLCVGPALLFPLFLSHYHLYLHANMHCAKPLMSQW